MPGPMHKRNFTLTSGECLNDDSYSILTFDVRTDEDNILLLLPESDDLDAIIGTSKWMVRQATSELTSMERGSGVEIVGPEKEGLIAACGGASSTCGGNQLEW